MKHAGSEALERLEDLLSALRRHPDLREKSRGVFYRRGKAFLHFHEDPAGLFCDLRPGDEWVRLPVESMGERDHLLAMVETIAQGSSGSRGLL